MQIDVAFTAIRNRIEAQWPALEPTVPIVWQNEQEEDVKLDASGNAQAWLMVEVLWSNGEAMSIGSPGSDLVRREAHVWCHAMVPVKSGVTRAMKLASEAAGILEMQDFGGVVFYAALPGAGQSGSEDGLFYGQSIAVPFYFDETA